MPIERHGPNDRAVRLFQQPEITGLSLSKIKLLIADPESDFPKPFEPVPGVKATMLSDLLAWLERRTKAAEAQGVINVVRRGPKPDRAARAAKAAAAKAGRAA